MTERPCPEYFGTNPCMLQRGHKGPHGKILERTFTESDLRLERAIAMREASEACENESTQRRSAQNEYDAGYDRGLEAAAQIILALSDQPALDRHVAERVRKAQIDMYEMLVMLPERSHEGACGPESGCDGACADIANFSDYVDSLYDACGEERLSSRVLAALRTTAESPEEKGASRSQDKRFGARGREEEK